MDRPSSLFGLAWRAAVLVASRRPIGVGLGALAVIGAAALLASDSDDPRVPSADTAWEVWSRDTFDRETPPRLEGEGRGIEHGLAELWRRTLNEGVGDDGHATFTRFSLRWGSGSAAERVNVPVVSRADAGLARLRAWRDPELLSEVARAHLRLIRGSDRFDDGATVDPAAEATRIVEAARRAEDRESFRRWLRASFRAVASDE